MLGINQTILMALAREHEASLKLLVSMFLVIFGIGLITAAIFSDHPVFYSIVLLLFFCAVSVVFKRFRWGGTA